MTDLELELRQLLYKHKIDVNYVVDEQDLPMVVGALSAKDIEAVYVDAEGGLVIEYTGDEQ